MVGAAGTGGPTTSPTETARFMGYLNHRRDARGPDTSTRGLPAVKTHEHDPRVRVALTAIMVSVLALTFLGMAALWPRGAAPAAPAPANQYSGVVFVNADIRFLKSVSCPQPANGTVCTTATVVITSRPFIGQQNDVLVPPAVVKSGIHVGDTLLLAHYPKQAGVIDNYVFVDFARQIPLGILAVIFAALVIGVGRLRGTMALVGLAVSFLLIGFFVLPALRHGESPLLVAAVSSTAIMAVIVYLTHGVSQRTTVALMGALTGIWLSTVLAIWAASVTHLNGLNSAENNTLNGITAGRDLSGILVCGIVLAGIGVLTDVTVTQATTVRDLHNQSPQVGAGGLFGGAMRVGRDHLGSTVHTLAFAYVGAAVPTLLLVQLFGAPFQPLLTTGQVAEAIVRTLVASIGIVIAIPLTTVIAALVIRLSCEGVTTWAGQEDEDQLRGRGMNPAVAWTQSMPGPQY